MLLKKLLISGAALAGFLLGTGEAKADYICQIRYYPTNGTLGSEGYMQVTSYTGPSCTGSFVRTVYLCTTGATSTSCAYSAGYRYERHSLAALFQSAQRAEVANQSIFLNTAACIGAGSGCGTSIDFNAN